MRRVNGRAIEDYLRFEVRETDLAVPEAEPLYRPVISNGYAPNDFIVDSSLVLYLPLYLLKGGTFKSVDRYKHSCTVTGTAWRPYGRYLDGSNNYIDIPDVVTEPCTICVWIAPNNKVASQVLFYINDGGGVEIAGGFHAAGFLTGVASKGGDLNYFTNDTWVFVAVALTRAAVSQEVVYVDGVDRTINPANSYGAAGTKSQIGARNNANDFKGKIGEFWAYNVALGATAIQQIYNVTRWRYQ